MKRLLAAVILAAVMAIVSPAHAAITNLGFESGTTGWTIDLNGGDPFFLSGSSEVLGSFSGSVGGNPFSYNPAEGNSFLVLGAGDWGIPVTATQTFSADAGLLKGMVAFVTPEGGPIFYNDSAFVTIMNGSGTFFQELFYTDVATAGDYASTGWMEWSVNLPAAGQYMLQYGVMNDFDAIGASYALFDAAPAPVPVPPSVLLLAPALLGLVGLRKKFGR